MGFFSNLWGGIKNLGSKIVSGGKYLGGKLIDGVRSAVNVAKKGIGFVDGIASKITSMPVVGDLAQMAFDGARTSVPEIDQAVRGYDQFKERVNRFGNIVDSIPNPNG